MATPPTPALTELLAHTRWIEELARSLVRDPGEAEDLAQSTLLTALEARGAPRRNLRAWLATVLRNKARERGRHESARALVERHGARPEALPSAEEIVERAECERRVVAAVLALEEPHRSTLLLRYFEGLSPEEIALRSNAPLATISSRITRAHARLREKLSGEGERVEWTAAIAPILMRNKSSAALSAPLVTGVFVMSTAVKVVVAASIVALVAWLAWPDAKPDSETVRVEPTTPAESTLSAPSAEKSALEVPANEKLSRAEAAAPEKPAVEAPAPAPVAEPPAAPPAIGGRIFGRVFRPDGEAAANRKIRMLLMGKGPEKNVRTDSTGSFDERGLDSGVWSLSTWPDDAELKVLGKTSGETVNGMAYLTQATVDLELGEEIELFFGKKSENAVRVTGRMMTGDKPADGFITWLPDGHDAMDRQRIANASAKKGYEVVLDAPGRHLLIASLTDTRVEFIVDVPDVREFTYDILMSDHEITGRVVTSDGKPVNKARVCLVPRAAQNPRHPASEIQYNRTTDDAGRFSFKNVPRARYSLSSHDGSLGKDAVLFPAAVVADDVDLIADTKPAEVVIVVPTGTKTKGVIRTDVGSVAFNYVFVLAANGEPMNAIDPIKAEKDGRFETFALAPGRWFAVAAGGERWSDVVRFEVPAQGEVAVAPTVEKATSAPAEASTAGGDSGAASKAAAPVQASGADDGIVLELKPAARLTVDITGLEPAWIEARDSNNCALSSLFDMHVFNRAVNRNWSSTSFVYRLPPGNYDIAVIGADKKRTARASLIAGQATEVRVGAK